MNKAVKPIQIGEDLRPVEALHQAQKKAFSSIEAVKQAYQQLEIGEFNQGVYLTIIEGKGSQIKEQYLNEARQSVERLNLPTQIRQNLLAGTEERLTPFDNACNALQASTYIPTEISGTVPFPLEVITIVEGAPTISDEAKEAFIEQRCRTYVNTPQEHRAYQKFKELEEAAAGFYTMLKEAGVRTSSYDFSELNQLLVKSENGTISFKPDVVKAIASKLQ